MKKTKQIKLLKEFVRQLPPYEKYVLKNGIEQTMLKYPQISQSQITDDFCELKSEIKAYFQIEDCPID